MSNPHDALFKLVFADPEHAGSLLRSAIPAELAHAIDWQSLERVSISFVDEELSERYADLLFAAKLGDRPALLYFLCEHQSTSDPWMPLRLLDYSVRAWTDWRRKHPDATKLPAIFPIVLHHSESGWSATTRFLDLIDLDEEMKTIAAPYLVRFQVSAGRPEPAGRRRDPRARTDGFGGDRSSRPRAPAVCTRPASRVGDLGTPDAEGDVRTNGACCARPRAALRYRGFRRRV